MQRAECSGFIRLPNANVVLPQPHTTAGVNVNEMVNAVERGFRTLNVVGTR
jgi:hypothetical protein